MTVFSQSNLPQGPSRNCHGTWPRYAGVTAKWRGPWYKRSEFITAIDAGQLPRVTFYKPLGNLTEHPGTVMCSPAIMHLADLVTHLEKSPQWARMLVVITYDESGGFWDHVAPPADRWGLGSRIRAIIISPFAKKGFVDHTQYDTTSVLRFITKRFDLPILAGLAARDTALVANGHPPMGDLTNALAF